MFTGEWYTKTVEEICRDRCRSQELLKQVPLEAPDIIKAAASNSVEMVKRWITKGGDVNARDVEGFTALHYAASRDHSDVVRTLLLHGADLRGHVKLTPLCLGIIHDSSLAVDVLLASGEDPNSTVGFSSALVIAAIYGAIKCLPVLLKHNADVNASDPNCSIITPTAHFLVCCYLGLEYQKFMKNEDTLLAMLKALVATDVVKIDQRQGHGQTALHAAASAGSFEAVKCLVEAGASPLIQNDRGDTPADLAQEYPSVQDYLLSCQGPVAVEGMKMASRVGGDGITTSSQAAACLVDIGCGTTLSIGRSKPSSLNPSFPQEINLPTGDSSSKDVVAARSLSDAQRQSSRLTLDPGAFERKTFLTLHEFHSPPVISVSKREFEPLKKKATSKREKKALRRVEKRKDKDNESAMRDLLPVGDGRGVLALPGSRWLYQGTEPHLSTNTSQLISPFTAVGTNHPVTLKRPGRLIIPHAARPVVPGLTESSVDSHPYHIAVQQMSLRDDGLGLTEWRSVKNEDVQPAEGSVTVMLRKLPLFSTFVVTAIRNTKDRLKGTLKNWMQKELEFCVVGSQYYSKVMIPRVVCFTNGATPSAVCNNFGADGTVDRLVVWGPSHTARAALDEDVRLKLSIKQVNWTVEPEERKMIMSIFSSRSISSVSFLLTAPSPHSSEACGFCYVDIPGESESLMIPFRTPTTLPARIHGDSSDFMIERMCRLSIAGALHQQDELPSQQSMSVGHQSGTRVFAENEGGLKAVRLQPDLSISTPDFTVATATQSSDSRLEKLGKEDADCTPAIPCASQLERTRDRVLDADGKLDVKEQAHLAHRISGKWEQLSILLSPELFNVAKIRQIRGQHEDLTIRAKAMIEEWCGHYHCKATRRLIIQALCIMSERTLASDIFGTDLVQSVQPI